METQTVIDKFSGPHLFLSNFYMQNVTLDDITYPSAEHAFQAAKCAERYEKLWIAGAPTPAVAKRRGRYVDLPRGWSLRRFHAMERVLRAKFSGFTMMDKLRATESALLIEGNTWHDNIWGDCRCIRSECRAPGKNHLGRLLMKVRDE